MKFKNVSFVVQISNKYGLEKVDVIHEDKPCYNSVSKKEKNANKCRENCSMEPGCNNRIHFHIIMHKDGNKISVITYFNSKPEY